MPTASVHMADACVALMMLFCVNILEEGVFASNQQMLKLKREHCVQPSAPVMLR